MILAKYRKTGAQVAALSAATLAVAGFVSPLALAEEATRIAVEDAHVFHLTYTASGLNLMANNGEAIVEPNTVELTIPETSLTDKTAGFAGVGKAAYFQPLFSDDFITKDGENATDRFSNTGLRVTRVAGPGKVFLGTGRNDQTFNPVLNTKQAEVTKGAILPVNSFGDDLAHLAFDAPGKYKLQIEAVETSTAEDLAVNPLAVEKVRAVSAPKVYTFLVGAVGLADTSDPFATPDNAVGNGDSAGNTQPTDPNKVPGDPMNPEPGKDPEPGKNQEPGKDPESGKDPEPGKDQEPGKDPEPGKNPEPGKDEEPGKDQKPGQAIGSAGADGTKSAGKPDQKLNKPNSPLAGSGTPGTSGITGSVSGAVKTFLGAPTCFASFEGGQGSLTIVPKVKDDRQSPSKWYNFNEISFTIGEPGVAKLPQSIGSIPAGTKVWMIGSTQQKGVPWVGANTMSDTIVNETTGEVTWTLSSFSGPGAMEVFTSGNFGTLVGQKWFSANGNAGSGSVTIPKNTHVHPNWVFTAPGVYRVGITQTATLKDGTQISGTDVLFFQVGAGNGARDGHFDIGSEVAKAGAKRVWKDAQGKPCTPTEADLRAAGLSGLAATGANSLTIPLLVLGVGLGVFGFALRMRPRHAK